MNGPEVTVLFTPTFAPTLHDLAIMLYANQTSLARILLADTLVFSRKSRVHRAQIRTNNGTIWIQIPIHPEDRKSKLSDTRIDPDKSWVKLMMQTLETAYGGSPYYEEYIPWFGDILEESPGTLFLPIALRFRHRIFEFLHLPELKNAEVYWSALPKKEATQKGVVHQGVDQLEFHPLYQEPDSKNYMPQIAQYPTFPFQHPKYSQHFGGFVPGLSLLDLLFEVGPESWKVIDSIRSSEAV